MEHPFLRQTARLPGHSYARVFAMRSQTGGLAPRPSYVHASAESPHHLPWSGARFRFGLLQDGISWHSCPLKSLLDSWHALSWQPGLQRWPSLADDPRPRCYALLYTIPAEFVEVSEDGLARLQPARIPYRRICCICCTLERASLSRPAHASCTPWRGNGGSLEVQESDGALACHSAPIT